MGHTIEIEFDEETLDIIIQGFFNKNNFTSESKSLYDDYVISGEPKMSALGYSVFNEEIIEIIKHEIINDENYNSETS